MANQRGGTVLDFHGREISRIFLIDNVLHIKLKDYVPWPNGLGFYKREIHITLKDTPQCCEVRFIHTDDNLKDFIGAAFMGIDVSEIDILDNGEDIHEVAFVNVLTSLGPITLETHNIHNGHYGGFELDLNIHREIWRSI